MDEYDKVWDRIDRESRYWRWDESDPQGDLDNEDFEISGFWTLRPREFYAASKAFYSGLAAQVAAMWGVNGVLSRNIISTQLLRFPEDKALAADRLIRGLPTHSRWPVVTAVYILYSFAKQRDEDYEKQRTAQRPASRSISR